jgi:hypothetical protein
MRRVRHLLTLLGEALFFLLACAFAVGCIMRLSPASAVSIPTPVPMTTTAPGDGPLFRPCPSGYTTIHATRFGMDCKSIAKPYTVILFRV